MPIPKLELDNPEKFNEPTFMVAMEDDKHEAEEQCECDYRYGKNNSDEIRPESTLASPFYTDEKQNASGCKRQAKSDVLTEISAF